jgi:phosphoglycerol transferase MdoB-like AlkP superfamily enzyme
MSNPNGLDERAKLGYTSGSAILAVPSCVKVAEPYYMGQHTHTHTHINYIYAVLYSLAGTLRRWRCQWQRRLKSSAPWRSPQLLLLLLLVVSKLLWLGRFLQSALLHRAIWVADAS